ncbi:hypothetical protein [Budvicia aquatica]|uniref:Cytochrome c biogenesis factor n=1 Tax=Budvicia aquatica TaxID=82979 RepID=A0A484ZMC8_9GAMM|nr:hypothetical protein [Budvicia aquatica]VFS49630.1 Cytochrome c biogenesis factor [Budvicia aquatica]
MSSKGWCAESASLVQELQQNLLEDIPDENNPRKTAKAQQRKRFDAVILLPGMALLIGVSLMVYYTVGGYSKVEEWQSVVARLPELRHQLMEKGPEGMGAQSDGGNWRLEYAIKYNNSRTIWPTGFVWGRLECIWEICLPD